MKLFSQILNRISFGGNALENYGKLAYFLSDYTEISGRLLYQKQAEKNILADVLSKLQLSSSDSVLDIGCGPGNLLIPLSFFAHDITGIDHPTCVERLSERLSGSSNVNVAAGNFLDLRVDKKFTKILCYSVLQHLENRDQLFQFIDKALALLLPGGRALFGDVPNESAKKRFINSDEGQIFKQQWAQAIEAMEGVQAERVYLERVKSLNFDDALVLEILRRYRSRGFHAYVLSQSSDLPFGNRREDILIVKLD